MIFNFLANWKLSISDFFQQMKSLWNHCQMPVSNICGQSFDRKVITKGCIHSFWTLTSRQHRYKSLLFLYSHQRKKLHSRSLRLLLIFGIYNSNRFSLCFKCCSYMSTPLKIISIMRWSAYCKTAQVLEHCYDNVLKTLKYIFKYMEEKPLHK